MGLWYCWNARLEVGYGSEKDERQSGVDPYRFRVTEKGESA